MSSGNSPQSDSEWGEFRLTFEAAHGRDRGEDADAKERRNVRGARPARVDDARVENVVFLEEPPWNPPGTPCFPTFRRAEPPRNPPGTPLSPRKTQGIGPAQLHLIKII